MEQELDVMYWNDLKSKLKQKYPVLTSADLLWRHTTREDLLDMIALKLGKTYREFREIIEKL